MVLTYENSREVTGTLRMCLDFDDKVSFKLSIFKVTA